MHSRIYAIVIGLVILSGCRAVEGAAGMSDPFAPGLGNGGYDVQHYTIAIEYDPATNELTGSTSIEAIATESLRTFNLDFQGMDLDSVEVNGSPASYSRQERELIVTPPRTLRSGRPFSARVVYHGAPVPLGSRVVPFDVGWFHSEDGSVSVMNYPDGAATWFPANDHQRDKATFRFEVAVPNPWFVLAPGSLLASSDEGARTRYVYEMATPMATTSAVLHIDTYEVLTMSPVNGIESKVYFPAGTPEVTKQRFAALPEALRFLTDAFGPYPFDRYSVVIADSALSICAGDGLANSEQTITLQCPTDFATDELTTVHELAHQWFGVSVAGKSMQESWLAEGPATYVEWMWRSRAGGLADIDQLARANEHTYFPQARIGKPPLDNIAPQEVYVGGALLLHALRLRIGEEAFFATMRAYLSRYEFGNAATEDFIEVAEKESGEDLQSFFDAWLLEVNPPPLPELPS